MAKRASWEPGVGFTRRTMSRTGAACRAQLGRGCRWSAPHRRRRVHPVGDRRPVCIGNRLDQVPQAFVLADGDGEADIHLTTGGDESVGVEAAVGPRRKLPAGPGTANPALTVSRRKWAAPRAVLARPSLQPGHQHVAGAGGDGQQGVIAPLAGIAVVARSLRWPVHRSRRWCVSPGRSVRGESNWSGVPPAQARANNWRLTRVELTDLPGPEAAQEGPQGGWTP